MLVIPNFEFYNWFGSDYVIDFSWINAPFKLISEEYKGKGVYDNSKANIQISSFLPLSQYRVFVEKKSLRTFAYSNRYFQGVKWLKAVGGGSGGRGSVEGGGSGGRGVSRLTRKGR